MRIRTRRTPASSERGWLTDSGWFTAPGGALYPMQLAGSKQPEIDQTFTGLVQQVGSRDGLVNSAVFARSLLVSQLRWKWRRFRDKEMFGSADLAYLDNPAMGLTRPQLQAAAEKHVSWGGTAYIYRSPEGPRLLRPDWVEVVFTSTKAPKDVGKHLPLDATLVGYRYFPGGKDSGQGVDGIEAADMAVWAPDPDPQYPWRGQSWITAMVKDIALDQQAEEHVNKFFENAATPNVVYSLSDKLSSQQLSDAYELFEEQFGGVGNAWKSIIIGGGADVNVVGSDLSQLSLRDLRGGIETRISTASRVPAVVLGIAEALGGSALMQGNYSASRRMWSDGWLSPVSQQLGAALQRLLPVPQSRPVGGGPATADAELWPDTSDILFLQEDAKDAADILATDMQAVRQGIDAGFNADAVVEAAMNGSLRTLLGQHTGLTSVQLTPPADGQPVAATNGGSSDGSTD